MKSFTSHYVNGVTVNNVGKDLLYTQLDALLSHTPKRDELVFFWRL